MLWRLNRAVLVCLPIPRQWIFYIRAIYGSIEQRILMLCRQRRRQVYMPQALSLSKKIGFLRKISLPKFNGGSLEPLIQIPAAKRNKALLKEREEFMERLARERRERAELERWAATTIQALARGFLGRPAHPERMM